MKKFLHKIKDKAQGLNKGLGKLDFKNMFKKGGKKGDDDEEEDEDTTAPRNFGQFHNYGPGTPLIPPQPTMLPPPMTYFHANFN